MIDYVKKLDALREYISLKIDWDISWPLMSFETYLEYKKDDPNVLHWLRLFLVQSVAASKEVKLVMDVFNQTSNLMSRGNYERGLANMSVNDAMRHYRNQGIAAQQSSRRAVGLGYGVSGLFGNIVGNSFSFPNPFGF